MSDEIYSRRQGRAFLAYQAFIASVRRGERSIAVGPEYVVLSRSAYDEILRRANWAAAKASESD